MEAIQIKGAYDLPSTIVFPTTLFLPPSHPPTTICTQLREHTGRVGTEQLAIWRVDSHLPGKEEKLLKSPAWVRRESLWEEEVGEGEDLSEGLSEKDQGASYSDWRN